MRWLALITASCCRGLAAAVVVLAGCGGGGGEHDLTLDFSYSDVSSEVLTPGTTRPSINGLEGHSPHCSINSGSLPPGIQLQSDCSAGGTATQAGTYRAVVKLTVDGFDGNVMAPLGWTVLGVSLVPAPAPNGLPGADRVLSLGAELTDSQLFTFYAYTPAPGDVVSFSFVSGTLPAGMTFNAADASLSGTPVELGTVTLAVSVTLQRNGQSYSSPPISIVIVVAEPPLTVDYSACCQAVVGTPFVFTPTLNFVPAGGAGIVFQGFVDSFPQSALVVDPSSGVVSGIPTTSGSSRLVVGVYVTSSTGNQSSNTSQPFYVLGPFTDYGVSSQGHAPSYTFGAGNNNSLEFPVDSGQTVFFAPAGTANGALPGDQYQYALDTSVDTPPPWITVDASTGVVTADVPPDQHGVYWGFGVKVTLVRAGVTYVSVQGWALRAL